MHMISTESKLAFLASLDGLVERHAAIDHEQFNSYFHELSADQFTAAEWKKMVDFSTDQSSRWQVECLFSPASAPNAEACAEMKAWRQIWMVFSKALVDQVPGVEEALREQHELTAAHCILARKLQHDAAYPWARIMSPVVSRAALVLNKVGFRGIGRKLYGLALYPPGTVGRSEQ